MSTERIEPMEGAEEKWLPIANLQVHPEVQRKFQEARARKLLAEFDPKRLLPLMVSNEDGALLVYEGQHRLWALTHWLGDVNGQQVKCYVRRGVPHRELAKDRLANDSQMKMTPIDRFLMAVLAEEPEAIAVRQVLAKYGLTVAQSSGKGVVQCVTACQRIVRRPGGVKMLDRVLGLLSQAYGKGPEAFHRDLVGALGFLVYKFGARMEDAAVLRALQQATKGAPGLVAAGKQVSQGMGGGTARGVARVVLRHHNKGKKKPLSMDDRE